MTRPSPSLELSGRRLAISLVVLIGLVAALVGGTLLWQHTHAPINLPVYHHTPNAINTGQSILYLSSPGFAPAPTQLTMVRTSDGAKVWQYALHGSLSTGESPTIGSALAAGQAVEVANGVVYVVDDPHPLGNPDREQELTALRASDGAVLWQRPVQGAFVEVFGVSDGVVCLRVTQQQSSAIVSSALYGYNAKTGALVWQRPGADVIGSPSTRYSVFLFDGLLYVTGGATIGLSSSSVTVNALLARTGQTLWQYTRPAPPSTHGGYAIVYPVAADNGVVVLSGAVAAISGTSSSGLIGIQERDGSVRWRYQASNIINNVPRRGANAPGILEQGGVLYFGTTATDTSLQLDSLQVTTGQLLWRQSISAAHFVLWDLAVDKSNVYAIIVPQWQGPHPSFNGLLLSAVEARSGTPHWHDRPAAEPDPYLAGTGSAVLYASQTGVAGVSESTGATLWHRTFVTGPTVTTADGTAVVSSVVSNGANTWSGTLCGLRQSTGAMRWCDQFITGLGAVVVGP
jgi:outer membrane protein assembly factor BamB